MVSIIVPIYKEKNINDFLKQFENLDGKFEIILISGDREKYDTNFKILRCCKNRAKQMNYGAKYAKFDILWFLHADSKVPKNSILQIENFLKIKELGAFEIQFDSDKFLMKICAFMSNLRLKFFGIAFGDQGIFIKKEIFYKLGKFREIDIMEDYDFSLKVKKKFKFTNINSTIITSSRRFLTNGIIKTMIKMQLCRIMFRFGIKNKTIARFYDANS